MIYLGRILLPLFLCVLVVTGTTFFTSLSLDESDSSASGLIHPWPYYEAKFDEWCKQYGLQFTDEERAVRLLNFAVAEDVISAHNAEGKHSFTLEHNEFSHLTWEEFRAERGIGIPMPERTKPFRRSKFNRLRSEHVQVPGEVDWSAAGAVTSVKNQQSCGSCWSFSATGAMEGAFYVKNSELVSFSEQMLVDCDDEDSGCNGGLMDNAFEWVEKNGGLCSEDAYPYTGKQQTCRSWSCKTVHGSNPVAWVDVEPSEKALMEAIAKQPVAVAIEADQAAFQFYSKGVFTGKCGTNLDHGVLAVGYGTSEDGVDFWKVKNSWGEVWGDDGYIYIERGNKQEGGQCGILLSASYPELA